MLPSFHTTNSILHWCNIWRVVVVIVSAQFVRQSVYHQWGGIGHRATSPKPDAARSQVPGTDRQAGGCFLLLPWSDKIDLLQRSEILKFSKHSTFLYFISFLQDPQLWIASVLDSFRFRVFFFSSTSLMCTLFSRIDCNSRNLQSSQALCTDKNVPLPGGGGHLHHQTGMIRRGLNLVEHVINPIARLQSFALAQTG